MAMTIKIEKWNGDPITKPGVYADVPMDVYHSQDICDGPSVSSSGLRRVLERNGGSPAHFYNEWSGNPNCEPQDDEKAHFIMGRAVHHLLLGEGGFTEAFCERPAQVPDRDTGVLKAWQSSRLECKAWMEDDHGVLAHVNLHPKLIAWLKIKTNQRRGRGVLSRDDIENIRGMATAVGLHPEVNIEFKPGRFYSLLNGHIEKSFIWKDKRTGIWCKARPDAIPTDSGDYADLKTTTSVAFMSLLRTITDYAYHQQAAMIMEGSRQCAGVELSTYTLVFVEKKRPHCVRPVPLEMDDILLGHAQNRIALDLIANCIKDKHWPGPGDSTITSIGLTTPYRTAAKRDVDEVRQQERAAS
jgi:PDDEXK-like domain of unknown function (DUF3799)